MTVKAKLLAAFLSIIVISTLSGLFGGRTIVIGSAFVGIIAGIVVANSIGSRLKSVALAAERTANGETIDAVDTTGSDEIAELSGALQKIAEYHKELARALTGIAQGEHPTFRGRGDHDQLGKAIQRCINNGRMLEQEVGRVADAIRDGKLKERCDEDSLRGSFGSVAKGINSIVATLVKAPGKAIRVMNRVVEGDLTARMEGASAGDHALFHNALNRTIQTLDEALARVGMAAQQVSSASEHISEGSQILSGKAAEQASAIEEVSSSLHEVAAMTRQNSDNAKEARTLSRVAEHSAEAGVESMTRLSEAINQIKASSDSTAKIIKTIDEIAFQTNLLALNAAVEAARAGDAGKGFAVVAEEVRNLAMRSAEAAKNTADLIEESVKNSENGVALNQEVLKNLGEIDSQVKKVGAVMAEIAEASEQQKQGVEQVNQVITQMSVTTQQVAANAQESATGAEELTGQADELRSMVHRFKLSGDQLNAEKCLTAPLRPAPQPSPIFVAPQDVAPMPAIHQTGGKNNRAEVARMLPLDDSDAVF